jgi:hypothetical protein
MGTGLGLQRFARRFAPSAQRFLASVLRQLDTVPEHRKCGDVEEQLTAGPSAFRVGRLRLGMKLTVTALTVNQHADSLKQQKCGCWLGEFGS